MKRLILLFVLFFNVGVFAQKIEYSIVVKDIETQLPIENAAVFILKTKQTLISNQDGKVTFMLTGGSNIQVSETNYEKVTLRWGSLKPDMFVVYLKSNNNKLDEIVVSKEKPFKSLSKIVANSKQKLAASYRLKVYVREFFMLDNKYSYYNDGLVNFQFVARQKKINTTLLVEQNRSYGLLETDVSADLKGYNLNNLMENYSNFKYFDPLLDSKTKKNYDFITKGHPKNKDYYVMTVIPLVKSKKALDSFEITYDPEKKLIIEFTVSIAPGNIPEIEDKPAIGSKHITRSFVKVSYRTDGLDYYLLSSNEEIAYDLILKDKIKNIQVRNNFVTTNFNKQNFTYKDSDVFTEKSLFNKQNKILTNYWDISGFTATEEEKGIIDSLQFKL
ncbi:carboxypeptidase-like regulatory domain-containing protein [Flavobacterium pectinovorum]|uniref:carboxypeptidase-like regulatory domain-containing protein n=1 Tax=Flavobacterium pectinovorum TaxID=29533 RepID=UPI0013762260|nr:carboxypeptidase-like regulatory domain-containing protein [Flavobacterium pectinovorum]